MAHLLPALHPGLAIQLFERDAVMEQLRRIEPSALANFSSWIVPVRDTQALLELKTVEHPAFLLQAAKYWLRIRRHLQQGDFQRYGYFGDLTLQQKSPLVYLVAPALHSIRPRKS